jgi:hypothetical protein
VLVEIRKIFSQRCWLWMTQGKHILISFSILPVKVISEEITEFLEYMSYYQEESFNIYLINL